MFLPNPRNTADNLKFSFHSYLFRYSNASQKAPHSGFPNLRESIHIRDLSALESSIKERRECLCRSFAGACKRSRKKEKTFTIHSPCPKSFKFTCSLISLVKNFQLPVNDRNVPNYIKSTLLFPESLIKCTLRWRSRYIILYSNRQVGRYCICSLLGLITFKLLSMIFSLLNFSLFPIKFVKFSHCISNTQQLPLFLSVCLASFAA